MRVLPFVLRKYKIATASRSSFKSVTLYHCFQSISRYHLFADRYFHQLAKPVSFILINGSEHSLKNTKHASTNTNIIEAIRKANKNTSET